MEEDEFGMSMSDGYGGDESIDVKEYMMQKRICSRFLMGKCELNEDECKFSHTRKKDTPILKKSSTLSVKKVNAPIIKREQE